MAINSVISHVVIILRSFEIEPKPLDRMLSGYFKDHKNLGSKERQLISDISFGIMRWRRRLEEILKDSGIRNVWYDQMVAAYLLWKSKDMFAVQDEIELVTKSLRNKENLEFDALPNRFPGGAAAYLSYPDFIYNELVESYGKEWSYKTLESLNGSSSVVIRVNTLKIERVKLKKILKEEGITSLETNYSPYGLVLSERLNLNELKSFKDGLFEVQEEGSQLLGMVVKPKTEEMIVDLCAGAGGKTLLLSMLMGGKGRIIASDIDQKKLNILKGRIKRAGATNIEIISQDVLVRDYIGRVDKLLIDAPCSGTGTIRRNPDLKWRINKDDITSYIIKQKNVVDIGARLVKKGGELIYATCSILPSENEKIAKWFEKKYGWNQVLIELNVPNMEDFITQGGCFGTNPAITNLDGFFACILKRPV